MLWLTAVCLLSTAVALRPPPLLQRQLQHLHDNRYVVIPNWLSATQTDSIRDDALAVNAYGSGIDCHVGNGGFGEASLDLSVRKSRQCLLYPPPPNAAGNVETRDQLIHAVNTLRSELQASATIALPHLEPFQTELVYLLYPVGGHYMRHLDNKRGESRGWRQQGRLAMDGGSFCGGRTRRVVSFILYLNRHWDEADGGHLRVFPAYEQGDGTADSQLRGFTEDIVPEGGTIVLLMSGDVEHLVRETQAERQCVVGWFREYREERVPDLDAMSLRDTLG